MRNFSLYILYAISFFVLVSAEVETSKLHSPLNNCILTVKSAGGKPADPRTLITYGILNRFAISHPSVDPLTIAGGGTSGVFEEHGNGVYSVSFSVRSKEYERWQLKNIVIKQWPNTTLFKYNVGDTGNWKILSVSC